MSYKFSLMEITALLDTGSLVVLILSLIIIILSGYIDEKTSLPKNRALQTSFTIVFLLSFLASNIVFGVQQMRIVVAIILITFILPFSMTFLSIWILVNKPSMTRIQYVSFVSWFISLFAIMLLRLVFGWGFPEGIVGATIFTGVSAMADGLLGGLIGHIIINKLENYRPSKILSQS